MNNINNNYFIGKLNDNRYLLVGIRNGHVYRMFLQDKDTVATNKREYKTYIYPQANQVLNTLYSSACDTGKSYYDCFRLAEIENMKADKVLARINA